MKRIVFALLILWFGLLANAQEYKRVISLVPSVTQSIYQLGAQKRLIGCTSYCKEGVADGKEVVSSAVKMNVEKIISLKPDVVIASGLTNPKDIETLRKFNINVVALITPIALEEIYNHFFIVGNMVGEGKKAGKVIANTRQEVQRIREKRGKLQSKPNVFFQIGADPIYAVLPKTFMNDYITILGGNNVANGLQKGSVGREFVLSKNPDYLFITTMGDIGEREMAEWKKQSNLKATKNGHIFIIDSEIACQPTPETFLATLKVMDKLMK